MLGNENGTDERQACREVFNLVFNRFLDDFGKQVFHTSCLGV